MSHDALRFASNAASFSDKGAATLSTQTSPSTSQSSERIFAVVMNMRRISDTRRLSAIRSR
jgi:hypothetical protein